MPVSKAKRRWRLIKTLVLAIAAAVALVWSAIESWGADPEELLEFFYLCLILLGITALLGGLLASVVVFFRKRGK